MPATTQHFTRTSIAHLRHSHFMKKREKRGGEKHTSEAEEASYILSGDLWLQT